MTKRLKGLASLWVWVWLLSSCSPSSSQQAVEWVAHLALPPTTQQVLLVTSADWQASEATLQRLQKQAEQWQVVGEPIRVQVGRNGMGWGDGLQALAVQQTDDPYKREGDGKAPAGVFRLGTTFGYASQPPQGWHMPYRVASERDYFIDAVDSPDYNQWRTLPVEQANEPQQHWSSFERMHRADGQYVYGMVVEHNTQPITVGHGSAIFMHVWLNATTPTSGCTAMAQADLWQVLAWLRPEAQPLLIQAPTTVLKR